jgi:hypothetical protein
VARAVQVAAETDKFNDSFLLSRTQRFTDCGMSWHIRTTQLMVDLHPPSSLQTSLKQLLQRLELDKMPHSQRFHDPNRVVIEQNFFESPISRLAKIERHTDIRKYRRFSIFISERDHIRSLIYPRFSLYARVSRSA